MRWFRAVVAMAILALGIAVADSFWEEISGFGRAGLVLAFGLLPFGALFGRGDEPMKELVRSGWAWLLGVLWLGGWIAMWVDRADADLNFVDEPSVVAISLGLSAIVTFTALILKSADTGGGLRSAIAATFILVFLLLMVYLLTIPQFRQSLSDVAHVSVNAGAPLQESGDVNAEPCPSPSAGEEPTCVTVPELAVSFVDGLFGVFTWAVSAIIIAFFGSEAVSDAARAKTLRVYAQQGLDKQGDPRSGEPDQGQPPLKDGGSGQPPPEPPPSTTG